MNKKIVIFLSILFLAGFLLRAFQLNTIPSGLQRDEAFLGYNAFSLLKTGKDMNGHVLPIHLQSFLYTPAGYSYITAPFVGLFGLNVFSIRLPSAIFGSLTIIVLFFLTKELLQIPKGSFLRKNSLLIACTVALLVAISPWNIVLSRTASVITIVVFCISSGTLSFLYWARTGKNKFLFLAFILFAISLLFYIAPYSFLPLFVVLLFILPFPQIQKHKKLIGVLYLIFILLPLILTLTSKDLSLRARSISIFTSEQPGITTNQNLTEDGVVQSPLLLSRVFHNKPLSYADIFLKNYFSHLSYDFFFTDQILPSRYNVPGVSLLYVFELIFLLAGTSMLFLHEKRLFLFLIGWILLVPLGSGLTFDDVPNIQRTLTMYPPLAILSGIGAVSIFFYFKNGIFYKTALLCMAVWMGFTVLLFFHQYFTHANFYRPWYRQEGYEELVKTVNNALPDYKKAIITNRESAPTIFFLFYSTYDPATFQKEIASVADKDVDRVAFAQYVFSQEECPLAISEPGTQNAKPPLKNVLYVNSGLCKIQDKTNILKTIKRSDGSTVFYVLTLQ